MDRPNHRKIHKGIIPSGGGIAIFLGFLIAFLFLNRVTPEIIGFIIGAFIIVILGITDDILGLSAIPKFIVQSLAVLIAIYYGVRIDLTTVIHGRLSGLAFLSIPLTYFWIVGITNAINIIDGLDGLAAGITTISAFTLACVAFLNGQTTVAVMALMLGFSALGFLPHNFRSRIFMGDTGSMFLGFSLAALSIMGSVKLAAAFALFVPAIILAIPIFDTLFAICRRILTKKPIYEGDKNHIHHRLLELGFSPLQTVIFLYIGSIFFGGMAVYSAIVPARIGYLILSASIILVVLGGFIIVFMHQRKMSKEH
jgi:UDP-GlcNAc:undecaprenyl-phosphate GlcNAc-1-phosphate transferase